MAVGTRVYGGKGRSNKRKGTALMVDMDKSATYAAEHELERWLDSTTPEQPTVNCLGGTFQPEPEAKFADPAAAQAYVDKVLAHLRDNGHTYNGRETIPVTVKPRRGATKVEYRRDGAILRIPPREIGGRWALRETTVLHELAHHLDDSRGPAHGPAFRSTFVRLLENIGSPVIAHMLQSAFSASGLNGTVPEDSDEESLDKIAKLLRQAEGTFNEHERDAFMARAQTLATRHSIALAVARAHTAKGEAREQPMFKDIRIGDRGKRGLAKYVELFLGIAHANDVRCTIMSDNTVVGAHGFPSDIDVCEALFASLLVQMVEAGERYLRSGRHREETVVAWSEARGEWVTKPMPTITARLAFYSAFADRIELRLADAREVEVDAATDAEDDSDGSGNLPVSTALALREKETAVLDFYEQQTKHVRGNWHGHRNTSRYDAAQARCAGDQAAREASLTSRQSLNQSAG